MVPPRVGCVAGLCAILGISGAADVLAAETPAEAVLKSKDLMRSDSFYVLAAESKVRVKYSEARTRYESLREVVAQQDSIESALEWNRILEAEGNHARNEIRKLQALLPTMRRVNDFEKQCYNQCRSQLALLEVQQSERQANIKTLMQGLPKSAERQRIKAEVESRLKTCQEAIRDLRQNVDATMTNYQELAKNGAIKKALDTLGRTRTFNLKLGPPIRLKQSMPEAAKSSGKGAKRRKAAPKKPTKR